MKKNLLKILILFLSFGLCNAVKAIKPDDVDKILNNLVKLTNTLADPKSGLPVKIDELNQSITKIKLFNKCAQLRKQKADYNFVLSAQDVKVSCSDYKDVLNAAKTVLEFIRKDAVGTAESMGVLYLILDILRVSGIKGVEKIQNSIEDINSIIENINTILDALKESKVKDVATPAVR